MQNSNYIPSHQKVDQNVKKEKKLSGKLPGRQNIQTPVFPKSWEAEADWDLFLKNKHCKYFVNIVIIVNIVNIVKIANIVNIVNIVII